MGIEVIVLSLILQLFTSNIAAELNETSGTGSIIEEAPREPRVSERIVKLYSGQKPDQIICSGEGFQADPKNCAVFYRCMKSGKGKYTVFKFDCGPGTVYDPDIEVCNHPQRTRRTECGGIPESTAQININEIDYSQSELPSPIVTNKPVYTLKPVHSSTVYSTIKTSSNSYMASITVYPWNSSQMQSPTKSSAYPLKTSTALGSSTSKSAEYIWGNLVSTTKSKEISVTPSSHTDNECISDGFMGDSINCRKFYRCVGNQRGGYIKYEFSCSELTIWDDEIQSCNHPWAVKRSRCGRSNHNYSVDSMNPSITPRPMTPGTSSTVLESVTSKLENTIQQQTQISFGDNVSQTQTQIANGPVIQNQTQINYGDRLNPSKDSRVMQNQTQVSNGSAISQSQTQIYYGIQGVQTQLQIDHSQQSSQSQTQIHETTRTTPKYGITNVESTTYTDKNTGKKCLQSGFMGDVNDCKKFYSCVDNGRGSFTRYEFSCGEGTVWDSKLEACNHAWAVEHCGNKAITEPVSQEVLTASTTSTTVSTQHDFTTSTRPTPSYVSSEPTSIDDSDNDDTGYVNQIQNQHTTMYPTTSLHPVAIPQRPNDEKTRCSSNGFIGDKNDCSIFYRCVDNGKGSFTQHEFKCGKGTLWDPDIEACNHAWAVKRCSSIGSNNGSIDATVGEESTTATSSTLKTTKAQSDVQTTLNNVDYLDTGYGPNVEEITHSSSTTTDQPRNNSNMCSTSGFMGDKNDCKKFYRCVDGGNGIFIRYEFTCGEGTVWDPKIESCNHAWAVESCGGSIVTESQHQETSSESHATHINEGTTEYYKPTKQSTYSTTTDVSTATTPIIKDNGKCSKSGLMGDKKDCKKFYRCVNNGNGSYTRYEFSCGEGTVWDPKIEACNHVWTVENCGETTEFINNNEVSSSPYPVLNDEELNSFQNNSSADDKTTQSTTTISENIVTVNAVCKTNGFLGDPEDCKKFYRCVDSGQGGFIKYEFTCGEGTVWDQSIESCNYASLVKDCGRSINQSTPSYLESTSHTPPTTEHVNYPQSTDSAAEIPEAESNITNVCSKEGFVGDKNDCKKFYRCVNDQQGGFIMYEFSCSEGTAWDPAINACNHMNDVGPHCSEISSSQNIPNTSQSSTVIHTTQSTQYTESNEQNPASTSKPSFNKNCIQAGFMGDEEDCQKFYRCVENGQEGYIRYEFTCGNGTAWVQDLQACDHIDLDNVCGSSATNPQTVLHEHDEMSTTTSKITTSTVQDTQNSHPNQPPPPPSNFSCKSEGFYGDPNHCKLFYRCVDNANGGFTKYDFTCGEGTMWDQELKVCNHESSSKDCSYVHSNSSQDSSNVQTTTALVESQSTTEKLDNSSTIYDDSCTSQGFFANSNDCSKFYRCVMNEKGGFTKYEFSCGEGTVWVQNLQACDFDNGISSCSNKNGSSGPQTTEEYLTSTSSSSTISNVASSSSTTTPQTQPVDNPNDEYSENELTNSGACESEGFFGDINDCRKFYRCVDNGQGGFTKYDFICGEGTAWDSSIQTCNHISEVGSCNGDISQGESNTTMHDEAVTQSSQSSGTTTTPTSSSMESSNTDNCIEEGYFGNTNDCKKFYRCVDNGKGGFSKYDFTCGEGTIWDQDITACNHPEDVTNRSCKVQQQESSTSATSSSSSSTTSQLTTEGSNQGSNNCSQEQSSKKPVNQNIKCDKAGYYGDQTDCKKFYRCVDWNGDGQKFSVYHFECGEGTIWDPALDTCNHEDSVYPPRVCSGAQSENENITEDNTTTTTEQTTTSQQSTTTPQSTTSEPTTQQTTTSEETTTQKAITSAPTTTQQSTTSEQTTTQQATTSTSTTTQQSTTSEQTTTQQTTTSTPTATQQSTTSEQTTTQQTTTSTPTPTTTQQSTTSEQTTTQQTTTSTPTTTQQSTTSEQTTLKTTTSEQTTQQSMEQTTTDQSSSTINESSTTEQSTTNDITESQNASEQTTVESSTEQHTTESSTTEQSTEENSTTETNSSKECPETDNNQYLFVCPTSFRRHPKYCNMFYQCTEDEDTHDANIAVFSCPNNTIYDESQTKCVEQDKADQKCQGETAQRRQRNAYYKEPIVVGTEYQGCPAIGYLPFEKDSECSPAFLKCQKNKSGELRGLVYKCPDGFIYWYISKRCELINQVRDCQRSSTDWSKRWEIPIETMNISKKYWSKK